jgi:hypothetical protein
MDVIPGGISPLAIQDQGRLFVPPAYYQVASDQAYQLNAAADWIAQKIVPECDFELSSIAWYVTAVGTQGVAAIELYSHDATNDQPNASLATLVAASDSGAAADAWIAETLATAQQLYNGKEGWIVIKGTDGDDFSVSTRRWNTAQGSMFPDSMPSAKYTTDSGSTWSACTQDSKPAIMNIILNPVATKLVPNLYYGRSTGKYTITTAGLAEIPVEGISLDCSTLTADTLYYVYLTTALALEATTTTWTKDSNGLMVKTGDTTKKLVGLIYPKDVLGGGDQAPVDCMDRRLIAYKGRKGTFGKLCPFASTTSKTVSDNDWNTLTSGSTDYRIEAVFWGDEIIHIGFHCISSEELAVTWGVNELTRSEVSNDAGNRGTSASFHFMRSSEMTLYTLAGFNYFIPLARRIDTDDTPTILAWGADQSGAGYHDERLAIFGHIL